MVLIKLKNPEDDIQEGSSLQMHSVTLELNETLEKTADLTVQGEKPKSPKSPKSPRQLSAGKKKEAAATAAAKKGKKTPNDLSGNDSQNTDGEKKKY